MTRIELVTSPLPRGCSTAKLHGHGTNYYGNCFGLMAWISTFSLLLLAYWQPPQPSFESREATGKSYCPGQMVWVELDSNQRKLSLANLQSASFSHSDIHPYKPVMGIEPATDGLQNRCSTAELHRA